MDIDSMINMEKRLGFGNNEIDDFLAKATAVEEAIKGMRDGTVDPATVKIEGIETDEERLEKERRREEQARLDRERQEALESERKKEERRRWWEGADAMFPLQTFSSGRAGALCDDEDVTSTSSRATRMLRYSADYSRWGQWQPSDPATKMDEQERAAEEERRRNEEFERNNREFCEQYMNDMAQREKLREKQAQSADANRLKGNNYFKAKKYDVALKYYLDALKSQPFDVKVLMNIAQAYLKTEGGQEDAMEFIARVLRLDPNHAKALSRKAFVLTQRGEFDEALKCATRAGEVESGNDDIKAQIAEITLLLRTREEERELETLKARLPSNVSPKSEDASKDPIVNNAVLRALAANDLTAMETAVEQTVILPAIANAIKSVDDLVVEEQKDPINESELVALYSKCSELASLDKNIRIYARTNQALLKAYNRFDALVTAAHQGSSQHRSDELFVAVLRFLTACIHDEDANRLVLVDRKSTGELVEKFLASDAASVTSRVSAPLIRFVNSFTHGSLASSQTQIYTRKNLIMGINSMLENVVVFLTAAHRSSEEINATADLISEAVTFLRAYMLNASVKNAKDSVVRKEPRVGSVVQNLALTLFALLYKCRGQVSAVGDLVMKTLEGLLGCSQHPELRRVFGESMRSVNFGNEAPACPTPLHAVALLSSSSYANGRYVDICLGILMNICLVDGPAEDASAGSSADIRDRVFESGCFDSVMNTVTAAEDVRATLEPAVLVRSAGLLARLSTCAGAASVLSSPGLYGKLCKTLDFNIKAFEKKRAANDVENSKWLFDERSHLIRVIASISKLSSECLAIAEKNEMVKTLLCLFPEPRKELNEITPSSVTLPPSDPASPILLGNVARCLMPLADDPKNADILYRKASLHGVEKLICAMATCTDMRVRKNIAILLAKGARNPETRSKIDRFRGMQMLIEMQKDL